MGTLKTLDILKWGPNIVDIRNFAKATFIADCEDASKAMGYSAPLKQREAEELLARTIDAAPPGVIFSSNPHYGIYAKWDNLLIKAGFKMASEICAINRVYATEWSWKGKEHSPWHLDGSKRPKWESPDGFHHWIHAMYLVKEPVPKLSFDWEKFDGANGDTDRMKMWAVGYGGRAKNAPKDGYKYMFEPAFARLAHNCGCAMGEGLPKHGKFVDEEFYTIAARPEKDALPEGYTGFLHVGGLRFAHNLKKLVGDTAQKCPHKFDVLG